MWGYADGAPTVSALKAKAIPKSIDALTGLRGVAACSVLLAHAVNASFKFGAEQPLHGFASRLAYFGMSLFFVLSGFVIQYNYADSFLKQPLRIAAWRFFAARFARLYPLYAVSILCALPSLAVLQAPNAAAYLTLTQSWFNVEMLVFPQAWSVSTEWFFYLAFIPLTALIVRAKQPARILGVFCFTAAIGLAIIFHIWREELTAFAQRWFWHGPTASAGVWGWLYYFSPYVRVLEFISGMLAAEVYKGRFQMRFLRIAAAGGLTWCAAVIVTPHITASAFFSDLMPNFIYAPAIVAVMLFCCASKGLPNAVLSSRVAVFLGEISYSIYVWSFAAISVLGSAYRADLDSRLAYPDAVVKVILAAGTTIVFAYGSYVLIEAPSRRWLRKMLLR